MPSSLIRHTWAFMVFMSPPTLWIVLKSCSKQHGSDWRNNRTWNPIISVQSSCAVWCFSIRSAKGPCTDSRSGQTQRCACWSGSSRAHPSTRNIQVLTRPSGSSRGRSPLRQTQRCSQTKRSRHGAVTSFWTRTPLRALTIFQSQKYQVLQVRGCWLTEQEATPNHGLWLESWAN